MKKRLFKFKKDFYINQYFSDYKLMEESAINWEHLCTYELLSTALKGHYQVLQLDSMQLSFAKRDGGFMHNALAPYGCISIAVIEKCTDKACFGYVKLHVDDILFFDDNAPINLIANSEIEVVIISIPKSSSAQKVEKLLPLIGMCIKDIDKKLSTKLNLILKTFEETKKYVKAEEELIEVLLKLIEVQTPITPKLTKGEKIALDIRNQVYKHMDGKIDIKKFAQQYNVSEQTLQNSFKNIFGFTPNLFFRLLKLNLAHRDLKYNSIKDKTVSRIASKWGFKHMGRFSSYYSKLFKVTPSTTLEKHYLKDKSMTEPCTQRQEEV